MKTSKIIVDGKEKEIALGINEEEIERNEDSNDSTIDLRKVVEIIDEQA